MNLLLKRIGMPGKTGMDGSQVQEISRRGAWRKSIATAAPT